MRQQVARSLGGFILLVAFVLFFAAYLLGNRLTCPAGYPSGYCYVASSDVLSAEFLAVVAGMTLVLGAVVLWLSNSIPPAPRPVRRPRPPEDTADFEDLWVDPSDERPAAH